MNETNTEGYLEQNRPSNILVAGSGHREGTDNRLVARCLNTTAEHITIKAGSLMANYVQIEADDVTHKSRQKWPVNCGQYSKID